MLMSREIFVFFITKYLNKSLGVEAKEAPYKQKGIDKGTLM